MNSSIPQRSVRPTVFRPERVWSARRGTHRRGLSALTLILSLGLVISLIALAVDIGLLVQRHQQLKTAGEAASLAAALQMFNEHPTGSSLARMEQARKISTTFAAENSFTEQRLTLDANSANAPQGDIVLGSIDPLVLGGPFLPAADEHTTLNSESQKSQSSHPPLNAILVRTRHSQAGGHGPILLLGQLVGVPSHDIFTESIAAVERRVIGYRPVGCAPIPMLPLLCLTECWTPADLQGDDEEGADQNDDAQGDDAQDNDAQNDGDQPGDHAQRNKRDRYLCNPRTGQVAEMADGIRELEFEIRLQRDRSGTPGGQPAQRFQRGRRIPAECLKFAEEGVAPLSQLVLLGLTPEDLVANQGEVRIGNRLCCADDEANGENQPGVNGEELQRALQAIIGQPRLLPLGCTEVEEGKVAAKLQDFAAGVVVSSQLRGNAITILVQPIVLNSCTAIVDSQVKPNPWVGKVLLVR